MPDPWLIAVAAFATINLAAFVQVGWDKRCAERGRRRVPEARLIAPVYLGGLPGLLFGMKTFRHKTVKRSFQLRVALATAIWLAALYGVAALILGPDPRGWWAA